MRDFYLHTRNKVYYAQLVDQATKRLLTAKSTEKTNRDEALLVVYSWLIHGMPTKKDPAERRDLQAVFQSEELIHQIRYVPQLNTDDAAKILKILEDRGLVVGGTVVGAPMAELAIDFLHRFWDYKTSPYVQEQRSNDEEPGEAHCKESLCRVENYWAPFLEGIRLDAITTDLIKQFTVHLSLVGSHLAPATRTRIRVAGLTAFRWAKENNLLRPDVRLSSKKGSNKSKKGKKTGVLTPDEVRALFALDWPNPKFKVANLLAATTGLRAGEIVGLKVSDIGADSIVVRCSWLEGYGEKLPKNGEVRQVPILGSIRKLLLELASFNPHGNGFVFWGQGKDAPLAPQHFSGRLKDMLVKLSLNGRTGVEAHQQVLDYWKARNIKFHSWRHFYSARMSDSLPNEKVMRATGHTTKAVFLEYADHVLDSEMLEIKQVAEATFGGLIGEAGNKMW